MHIVISLYDISGEGYWMTMTPKMTLKCMIPN